MNRSILFLLLVFCGSSIGGIGLWMSSRLGLITLPGHLVSDKQSVANQPVSTTASSTSQSPDTKSTEPVVIPGGSNTQVPATVSAADRCHELSAHPDDPQRIGAGVADVELDTSAAMAACSEAVASNPEDPLLNFQLGRVLQLGGYINDAEAQLLTASQGGHAAANAHFALLYMDNPDVDLETLVILVDYAQASIIGGYEPGKEVLAKLESRIEKMEEQLKPKFDLSLFQNQEIIQALWNRDFTALDNLTSGFYIEDYGVPKTFTEYAVAFATQLNAPYPVLCPGLTKAGIAARLQSKLEHAVTNMSLRNPTQSLQILGQVLGGLLGGNGGDPYQGMANLQDDTSRGIAMSTELKEEGTKDALILLTQYGCESDISKQIATSLSDYAYGNY